MPENIFQTIKYFIITAHSLLSKVMLFEAVTANAYSRTLYQSYEPRPWLGHENGWMIGNANKVENRHENNLTRKNVLKLNIFLEIIP